MSQRVDLSKASEDTKAMVEDLRFRGVVRRWLAACFYWGADEASNGEAALFSAGRRAACASFVQSLQTANPKGWARLVAEEMDDLEERQLDQKNRSSTNG